MIAFIPENSFVTVRLESSRILNANFYVAIITSVLQKQSATTIVTLFIKSYRTLIDS